MSIPSTSLSVLFVFLLLAPSILSSSSNTVTSNDSRKLKGRFLHITDLHPDPKYKYGTDIDEGVCHRKIKARKSMSSSQEGVRSKEEEDSVLGGRGKGAGWWGEPESQCDAPLTLVDSTFDWLSKHLTSPSSDPLNTSTSTSTTTITNEMEIDFVLWSGDNSRHDLDPEEPRSLKEIYDLNRYVAGKMKEYLDKGVVVLTCFGNNDVFPHNTMFRGPSSLIKEFSTIWDDFIPSSQRATFLHGGYYSIEAIPSKLLLISLNTMYMYDANKIVKGCPPFNPFSSFLGGRKKKKKTERIDPGTEELIWLEGELERARVAGMQVWLVGHVSPELSNWYEECYYNYGEIVLRYHDTILGQVFGHANTDHFSFYSADEVYSTHSPSPLPLKVSPVVDALTSPIKPLTLEADLKEAYKNLPEEHKREARDYSIINVNPSVIPTYLPSLRIWQYNITEVEGGGWKQGDDDENDDEEEVESTFLTRLISPLSPSFAIQQILSTFLPSTLLSSSPFSFLTKNKKKKLPPRLPRHSSPSSPAQSNTFLTPLGYTQFYLDLESANKNSGYGKGAKGRKLEEEGGVREGPEWEIEYMTFDSEKLARELILSIRGEGVVGIPKSLIPGKIMEVMLSLDEGEVGEGEEVKVLEIMGVLDDLNLVPYDMKDLTVGSWLNLAKLLSESKKGWKGYVKRMTLNV